MKLQRKHLLAIAYALGVTESAFEFADKKPSGWAEHESNLKEALEIIQDMVISFEFSNPDEEPYVDPSHVN